MDNVINSAIEIESLENLVGIKIINDLDTSRAYEVAVTDFAKKNDKLLGAKVVNSSDYEIELMIKERIKCGDIDGAYNLFYAYFTYHRRHKNLSVLDRLIEDYLSIFKVYSSFRFLNFLFCKQRYPEDKKTPELGEKLIANPLFETNDGVIHAYAEAVAEYVESDIKGLAKRRSEQIENALNKINEVIERNRDYAKFYCTQGRLLILSAINSIGTDTNSSEDRYQRAIKAMHEAIDREPSNSGDYNLRISQYQFHINEGQRNYGNTVLFNRIVSGQEEIDHKMSRINIKNLEFLGFFIAVISFTLGSLQLASSESVMETAILIITLMSTLLIAFSAFGFILHGVRERSRTIANTIVALMGVIMLIFSLYYLNYHV